MYMNFCCGVCCENAYIGRLVLSEKLSLTTQAGVPYMFSAYGRQISIS